MVSSAEETSRPSLRARDNGLKKAVSLIHDNAHEPITVLEICKLVGVSWRTLEYAFQEYFGITPKRYLTIFRLNAVRKDLLKIESNNTICQIANHWGFWHMGQFSADYKKLFGELPSETVKR